MNKNNTKIVATMGPSTNKKETLKKMIEKGVSVCRLNFSHGDHKAHLKTIKQIKEINKELGVHTAILADLQGPKIRLGEVKKESFIEKGSEFILTTKKLVGNTTIAHISYKQFPKDVKLGEKILIDDGKIQVQVVETNKRHGKNKVIFWRRIKLKQRSQPPKH